jgi:hypothetical protein
MNPDKAIRASSDRIAVTSDSNILDGVKEWINLGEILVAQHVPEAWVVDFFLLQC